MWACFRVHENNKGFTRGDSGGLSLGGGGGIVVEYSFRKHTMSTSSHGSIHQQGSSATNFPGVCCNVTIRRLLYMLGCVSNYFKNIITFT